MLDLFITIFKLWRFFFSIKGKRSGKIYLFSFQEKFFPHERKSRRRRRGRRCATETETTADVWISVAIVAQAQDFEFRQRTKRRIQTRNFRKSCYATPDDPWTDTRRQSRIDNRGMVISPFFQNYREAAALEYIESEFM